MKKILICDDEKIIRTGIRKILLDTYGEIEIEEASNGMEGYKIITLWNPDLVISDIRMPSLDGLGMIEKSAQVGIKPHYIIISAYRDFEYARTAIRCGVSDYILKPINRFELIHRLNDLLPAAPVPKNADARSDTDTQSCIRPGTEETAGTENAGIAKAIRFIENNFFRNITLEEVSETANMNPSYFSTAFKAQTGQKYIDYLTDLRMDKARNLIMNTDLKIANISSMVGYGSTKYFTKIYKRKFGFLPSDER